MSNKVPIITEIDFRPIKPSKGLMGFISLVYDSRIHLDNIAIFTYLHPKNNRLYRLAYPTGIKVNGVKRNFFHPINDETRDIIEQEVNCYLDNLLKK